MSSYLNIYKGKKVFITGHTGFKGAWLSVWLQHLGANVKGYSLPSLEGSLFEAIHDELNCESIFADIRDKKKLEAEILNFQPDFIFHLAAQALVLESYREPRLTFETNVMGTIHVLEATRSLNKPCTVVIATTDKVYLNKETDVPYKEEDSLGGFDPYSASKAAAEIAIASYRSSYFHSKNQDVHKKGLAVARAGNVIGGGDSAADRIIPDLIRSIKNDKELLIRNPESIRPWQHVLEPLSAYLLLGAKLFEEPIKYSTSFNVGPETKDVLSVQSLIDYAIAGFGKGNYKTESNEKNPHEAKLLMLDISKAKKLLGWKPQLNSSRAIQITMEWYKEVLFEEKNAMDRTIRDIIFYSSLLSK